ncbi:hypothetical protein [Algoriphagus winogradskyi]|uniref:Uncharacterized protein n=1 Tax=Algoriphagus winogradskyi TaxID=237017 RepID=A0ABY1PDM1_9BACT|nr:hypothetical protein [Algoriphagus winogradskyi]SMP31893.1 hypothetical protein SAMN06265367_107228 [Algoriphagus winogradskyi]
MKIKLLFGSALFLVFNFFSISLSVASGARKVVNCRTLDVYDNVLANGSRCDFGWSDCIPNPCPSPDGTRVEWEAPSMGD